MRVLILDTETTALSPNDGQVIEVAVALFDCEYAIPMTTYATLIEAPSNGAEHINKIPPALLTDAIEAQAAWARVEELVQCADCILAHNAPFDRSFTPKSIADLRPWVCSMRDLELPEKSDSRKLTEVCLAHGVAVIGAHRALTDVDLLVRLLTRLHERGTNLVELFERALSPKPLLAALVSYDDRDKAKAAGFVWNAEKKRWERRMTLADAKKLPFKTKALEPTPHPV